mgnify:CR=1 FL=1
MRRTFLVAMLALATGTAVAQMTGGTTNSLSTTTYFPLVDGAHYEYTFTRGPWSAAMADLHAGQNWGGVGGLTAMHMTYTCAAGVPCAPDATDFYGMGGDGIHYYGGMGADDMGQHYSMTTWGDPEWLLKNPVTPGTMMGGMYQNAGAWNASVHGSHSMMGTDDHMSSYQALALETVSTPAGTFANALHVHEQRGSGYARDVWYAPNVGIVMMSDARATMMLAGYTIPGANAQPGGGTAPLAFTPTTGLWWNPVESGTGYNIQVQHGTLVVTMYSYTVAGDPIWYLVVAPLTNAGSGVKATGTLDKFRGGPCAACGYATRPGTMGNDGTVNIVFETANAATVQLPGGRVTKIQPQVW